MRILLVVVLLVSLVAVGGAVEEPDSGMVAERPNEALEERIKRSSNWKFYSLDENGGATAGSRSEERYNRNGDEIESVYFDEDGNIIDVSSQEHEYWEDDVLKRTHIYRDGDLVSVVEFDDEGRKVRTISHSLLGVRTTRYSYDAKGREIAATLYDDDGMVRYIVNTEYNIVGEQLVRTVFNDGEKIAVSYFDENDLRIRDEYYDDGILDRYWLREYNQFGDEIRAEGYDVDGLTGTYTETTYIYRD